MANIHVPKDPPPQPTPYLGYRKGHGMPSAREPMAHYTDKGRKVFDKMFSDKIEEKKVDICQNKDCEYFSIRKKSQCAMYDEIYKCGNRK